MLAQLKRHAAAVFDGERLGLALFRHFNAAILGGGEITRGNRYVTGRGDGARGKRTWPLVLAWCGGFGIMCAALEA